MPAFDPVRDAASVSPMTSTVPLPASPTRRAPSLSMLLNQSDGPDSRPGSSSSSYSQNSLYGSPYPTTQNGFPKPALPALDTATHARPPSQSPVMQPRSALVPASPISLLIHPTLPGQSPTLPLRRSPHPANMNNYFPPPPPPVMPPPAAVPYQPSNQKRKTHPNSVLKPLSTEEARNLKSSMKRNKLRSGPPATTSSPSHSRPIPSPSIQHAALPQEPSYIQSSDPGPSRVGSYPPPAIEANYPPPTVKRESPPKRKYEEFDDAYAERERKRSRDSGLVADHYNHRPEVGKTKRLESPIIHLKKFNNWIKSVLITKFAAPAFQQSQSYLEPERGGRPMRGKVLDMGCGKGGDLQKWSKANVAEYVGVDIAEVSVQQAHGRWEEIRGRRFHADFAAFDCYANTISSKLPAPTLSRPFDAVSMQFCMHYAFETQAKTRTMLDNVSRYLRPGGVFIGTIPNPERLMHNLRHVPPDSPELSFGNSVYRIRFDTRDHRSVYGHRYWFFLEDAVENVPEYVVFWQEFVSLALEYGLHLIYRQDFQDIFMAERTDRDFAALLQRMGVVDGRGKITMDPDQWEASNVYLGFAFEKKMVEQR